MSVANPEIMHQIEELYNRDIVTSEIGFVLGLTKNQVIGLINRGRENGYNFPKRTTNFWISGNNKKKGKRLTALQKHKMSESLKRSNKVKDAQFKRVSILSNGEYLYKAPDIKVIPPEGLQLLEMPSNGCKYPIGQRGETHLFCSKPKVASCYCLEHLKIMWPKRYGGSTV